MTDLAEISARVLRLILACLTEEGSWDAFDTTLTEFEGHPDELRLAIRILSGMAAAAMVADHGGRDGAISKVTQALATDLDSVQLAREFENYRRDDGMPL